jgi:ADP-ribosyl-[dinitrogen reductase] hydrolase
MLEVVERATAKSWNSLNRPLEIAAVRSSPRWGKIGLSVCPGMQRPATDSAAWNRDIHSDSAVVAGWGAAAVATLVEDDELRRLGVRGMGEAVRSGHMDWIHCPIAKGCAPDADFEREWTRHGEGLRARLRSGFNVLVHGSGGLGRAAMIAARLLAELGVAPSAAVAAVRQACPGAPENQAQLAHVLGVHAVEEFQPDTGADAIRDRGLGAMLGLAIGDALGATLEYRTRDSREPVTDMVGGGPFRLKAGQWTDDTAMALALADSLARGNDLDEQDLMSRFAAWWRKGEYSCTGTCFDIGAPTVAALTRWQRTREDHCGATAAYWPGAESLVRIAPVALRLWRDRAKLRRVAARQSQTTHACPEAVEASVLGAELVADAIAGRPRSEVLRSRAGGVAEAIDEVAAGSWRGKARGDISASGYVARDLEAALWSVGRAADFRGAVLLAANLGQECNTTAAIAGQLAGALCGAALIPASWRGQVAWSDRLSTAAARLMAR